jgi:hypothetical protein
MEISGPVSGVANFPSNCRDGNKLRNIPHRVAPILSKFAQQLRVGWTPMTARNRS